MICVDPKFESILFSNIRLFNSYTHYPDLFMFEDFGFGFKSNIKKFI